MNMPSLIIDRPDLQTWRQRAVFGALTAVFWIGWVFLWLPAVTLVAWFAFGYQFRFHMIELEGYKGFVQLLAVYALVIAAMGGSLVLWAKYNHLRFRGVERRRDFPLVGIDDTAGHFQLPPERIAEWRAAQMLIVHHDERGAICGVQAAPQIPTTRHQASANH